MKRKSIMLRVVSAALLSLSSALAFAQQPPGPTVIVFPMIGIAGGETLQLNAVSSDPSCQLILTIYDSSGTPVEAIHSIGGSGSGKVAWSEFRVRREVRAEAIITPPPSSALHCMGRASVEVYGNLLKSTSVIVTGLIPPGPSQSGLQNFGPVGVRFLQTVRLNVVAYPPDPCIGALAFSDLSGNPLGSPTAVNLAPGQATFIDLPGESTVSTLGPHSEVLATFTPNRAAAPGTCLTSVEVYEPLTGRTRAVLATPDPNQ